MTDPEKTPPAPTIIPKRDPTLRLPPELQSPYVRRPLPPFIPLPPENTRCDPTLKLPRELQPPKWTSKMWCEIDDDEDDSPYMRKPLPPFIPSPPPPDNSGDDQNEAPAAKLDKGKEAKEKEFGDVDANKAELEECEPLSREWFSRYGNGKSSWEEYEPYSREWFSRISNVETMR